MIKNKLFIALTFALIPSSLILSATTRNVIAETQNSSKLIQCLKNIRDSRASQAITESPRQRRRLRRVEVVANTDSQGKFTNARLVRSSAAEVAIDIDSQGKVTNVRLVRSSGNTKLDEEALIQARNFKLKPSLNNDVGVNTTPIKRQNAC